MPPKLSRLCIDVFILFTKIAIVKTDNFFLKRGKRKKNETKPVEATHTRNLVLSFPCVPCCMLTIKGGTVT